MGRSKKAKYQKLMEDGEFGDQDLFNCNKSINSILRVSPPGLKEGLNVRKIKGESPKKRKLFLY